MIQLDEKNNTACDICGLTMRQNDDGTIECWSFNGTDHYMHKKLDPNTNELASIKFRLSEMHEEIFCKISFEYNYMYIYTDFIGNAVDINTIFYPDFSDLKKLKNKLKTYLVFS